MSINRHVRYIARIGQYLVLAVNESDKAFQPDNPGRVQLRVVQGHLYWHFVEWRVSQRKFNGAKYGITQTFSVCTGAFEVLKPSAVKSRSLRIDSADWPIYCCSCWSSCRDFIELVVAQALRLIPGIRENKIFCMNDSLFLLEEK